MDEVDEVAQAIYEQFPTFFPMTCRTMATGIARGALDDDEAVQLIDNLADALMQIKPKPLTVTTPL